MLRRWLIRMCAVAALLAPMAAYAQTCTNVATGNWGAPGTWNCTVAPAARVPANTDNVVIINNTTVTVNIASAVAGSVTINGGANATTLAVGANTLTVTNAGGRSGDVIVNAPTANITKQITVTSGTLSATGNMTFNGGTAGGGATNISQVSLTTGLVSVGGNLLINAGTVNTNVARLTVTTGTVNVTGSATLTGGAVNSRDALISVTGASATTGVTIGGALNINAPTVATSSSVTLGVAGSRMTVNGTVNNNDVLTVGPGTFSAAALNTGSAASALAVTTSVTTGSLSVTGNATVNSGTNGLKTFTLGNGLVNIGGALDITTAAATNDGGDTTVSVTGTGTMNITGNVTLTGGSNANRDALLTVSGVSGVGAGVNISGGLTIASTIAGSSTVSLTNASSRMNVNGAAGVINNDTMTVGVGIFGITNAGASLTIGSGASAIAATTAVTTGSLTVAGNVIVDSRTNGLKTLTLGNGTIGITGNLSVTAAAATADTGDATASVTGTGTMNIGGNVTVTGGTNANRDALLTVSGVSGVGAGVNISGGLTIASTIAASSTVSLTNASSRMNVNGAAGVINNDTMTVGVGIFGITNAAATLTIGSGASTTAATTAVTTGSLTVAGNVIVDSRTDGLKTLSLTTGTIGITGNLNVTAAAATADTGDATASVTTGTMNVGGNVTVTGGTNANRDALLTVTGASAVGAGINISGSLTTTATVAASATVSLTNASSRMVVSGAGGVSNGDTVAVGVGIFSMTNAGATYTNSNAAILATTSVSTGSIALTGALSNATGETVAVTGAGSLTVSGALTNAGTMTIATTSTVNANGNFSNSGTVTVTGNGQLFLRGATSTINGTFTRGTGTVTMNGSVAQALSGTALEPVTTAGDGFHNFTINNAAGVTLGSNVVARNVITLTSGEVGTGVNVLVSELSCATPSVSRTSGHIVGNFQKLIPAGGSTCNYEIGSAGAYTPASLTFTGVTAGRLIATTVAGDHPNIATSGFTVTRTVNRYWRLTTTGVTGVALTTFTNYSATLTFINPGDLDVGVDPALFDIRRWNGATWSNVTTGTRTATSTQGTGITALGDLQIGEGTPPAPSSFNAFETSTGAGLITGVIRTKRAGVAFSLDVVAILSGAQHAAFVDPVIVDLLGNNTLGVALDANNCPTSFTVVQTVGPNPSITGGRATVNFTAVANSWRDVRVRVRWPTGSPTVTSCSTDNFAIRPDAIGSFAATNATRTTAGITNPLDSTVFGATVHNAGRPFSFRARAVNASLVDTTNYAGSPLATLTTCVGAACTATQAGLTFTTTFVAGLLATDTASYPDVGSFSLQLTDDDFASVDASDGSSLGERRIASAVINVGRFTPDNFAVATNVPVFLPACTGFTYQGQAFNYSTAPVITVTARDASGNTTTRYSGDWWRLTNSTLTPALQSLRYVVMSGVLDTASLPATAVDPLIRYSGDALPSPPAAGTGTLTFSGGPTGLRFTRAPGTPSVEFNAEIALSLNVIDADSVVFASNPVAFGAATAGNGILFSDANALTTNDKRVRYGRLRLGSTSGSQVLSLRVPVEAQYWNGTSFITNTLDSCTTLVAGNVGLGNYTGNLGAGETTATITTSPLKDGRSAIQLSAPGAANFGGVDVTLNLGAAANADACNGFAPAATAGNLAHLRGLWCAPPGTYSKDPAVRVRFGVVRSSDQSIYRREQ